MEQIEVGAYNCQIKKQNSKTQSITFIDQPKFNKNEDFYKAKEKERYKKIGFIAENYDFVIDKLNDNL